MNQEPRSRNHDPGTRDQGSWDQGSGDLAHEPRSRHQEPGIRVQGAAALDGSIAAIQEPGTVRIGTVQGSGTRVQGSWDQSMYTKF